MSRVSRIARPELKVSLPSHMAGGSEKTIHSDIVEVQTENAKYHLSALPDGNLEIRMFDPVEGRKHQIMVNGQSGNVIRIKPGDF